MFEQIRSRLEIERIALESLEYHFDGACAIISLTKEQIERTGVEPLDLEGITSLPRMIEGVRVGITLRQQPTGKLTKSACAPKWVWTRRRSVRIWAAAATNRRPAARSWAVWKMQRRRCCQKWSVLCARNPDCGQARGLHVLDVVAKLRGICKTRKIGHSGTLDPMATGVLPVFIGGAAKAVDMQQNTDKAYDAVMLLGRRTDTGDVTGETLEEAPLPPNLDEAAVRQVLDRFLGPQMQLPPMYSAVKMNGQPLYKAARRGETVERKPRPVTIHSLTLTGRVSEREYALHVACGKGTYVRTLVEDIGTALGVPATLAALRRTQAGPYTQEQAVGFEQIQQARDEGRLGSFF